MSLRASRSVPLVLPAVFCVMALTAMPVRVVAQHAELTPLRSRLDDNSFRALSAFVDSAKGLELPVGPLVSKVQEGLLKRAALPSITAATQSLLQRLRQSRTTLGPSAGPVELEAAAGALAAGAAPDQLADLRTARDGRSITVPLVVLTDLITRGVPRDSASLAMKRMVESNATDAAFTTFRHTVEQDIAGGLSPAVSVSMRYRNVLERRQ